MRSLKTIDIYDTDSCEESRRCTQKAARFVHRNPPPHLQLVVINGRVRPVCHCHRSHAVAGSIPSLSFYDPADTIRSLDEYDLEDWVWLRKFDPVETFRECQCSTAADLAGYVQ